MAGATARVGGHRTAVDPPADVRFEVVYATSRPARQVIYDPTPARELLGFEPLDTWPEGVEDGL